MSAEASHPLGGPPPGFPVFGARPWIMGILNVTPDSFSDGGRWSTTEAAVAHAVALGAAGADIVDVGGESTRPGAHRVPPDVERDRVVPVIAELSRSGLLVSVDTTRASVAAAALAAGAHVVNDVSGGLADPDMLAVIADSGAPCVLMHWRGPSDVMNSLAEYQDVVADVRAELLTRVQAALDAGVHEDRLIIDPGLGFAKNAGHNWELLAGLEALVELDFPVLIGASRKRFLGQLLADQHGEPRATADREWATAAVSLVAARHRVWGIRTHEPKPTADALAVWAAVDGASRRAGSDGSGHPGWGPGEPAGRALDLPGGPGVDGMRRLDGRSPTGPENRGLGG